MTSEEFKHDYDLAELKVVVPRKRDFEMLVTPRFVSVYGDSAFEAFTADLLLSLAQESALFIDIGAHYGFYTLLVGTRQRNRRMIAFEPVPENYEVLRRNVELNNLRDVELHNLALSDKSETRELNVTEGSDCCGFYEHPLAQSIKKIQVSAVALDDFLQDIPHATIALKVDVEGHEVSVLEGMKRTLREADDIRLFMEFNPECLRQAGHEPDDLLVLIDRLGFDIYFIDDEYRRTHRLAGDDLENWGDYVGDQEYANILCRRKGQSQSACFFSHSSGLATADRGPRARCSGRASHGPAPEGLLDPHAPVRQTRMGNSQQDSHMRICYVSRECAPYTTGGIGTYISNVLRAMSQAGHEVTLVSDFLDHPQKDRAKAELEREGISVVVPDALPDDVANSYYHPNHEYADRVYHVLRRNCSDYPLDVIEFPEYLAEGFTCVRAKRLLGEFKDTTLVVKCHTPTSLLLEINNQQRLSEGHVYAVYMEDYCLLHADVVTSPSQSLARYYKTRLGLDELAKSPCPLALPPIAPAASCDHERSIAFVGRLEWRKGIDLLVKALVPLLRAHADVVIDCYGGDTPTGPFETSMLEYLTRRCIPKDVAARVRFHGQLPYHELMRRMAGASVCVFPSRWEAVGYVCLEAMSVGLPVVVSQNGGMGELVEDGKSGFVVDPEDSEMLADKVQSVLSDNDLSKALGEHAKTRAHQLCNYISCAREIERSYTPTRSSTTFSHLSELETHPRVSVIIPFYNQGEWLEQAVESAVRSNYENIEVIVVNDGSTDPASNAVFDRLEDRRLKKISKSNEGPASARNAGIGAATGDFILPLDADDIVHPEYVPVAVQALLNNPRLAYVTCYVEFFGQHHGYWMPIGFVRDVLLLGNPAAVACSLFRREALEQVGGYDELVLWGAEDWDLLVRLATTSWDGDVVPCCYFLYRRHADSLTDQYRLPNLPSLLQYMARKYSDLLREHGDELLLIAVGSHGEYQRAKPWIEKLDAAVRIAPTDALWQLVGALQTGRTAKVKVTEPPVTEPLSDATEGTERTSPSGPLISVVIPTYNDADFVGSAVQSALEQVHTNIEVIVVDDGSTDNTREVLKPFLQDQRVRYLSQENRGLSPARNRGIAESRGEYLNFLDADDYLHPSKIAKQVRVLESEPLVDLVYCDVTVVDRNGQTIDDYSVGASRKILDGDIFDSLMLGGYFPPHVVLLRRRVLDQVGVFDEELSATGDLDLWLRASAEGFRARYIDEKLASYRRYPGTMSQDEPTMQRAHVATVEKITRRYPARVARSIFNQLNAGEELYAASQWLAISYARLVESYQELKDWAGGLEEYTRVLREHSLALEEGQQEVKKWALGLEQDNQSLREWALGLEEGQQELEKWAVPLEQDNQKLRDWALGLEEGQQELKKWALALEQDNQKLRNWALALEQDNQNLSDWALGLEKAHQELEKWALGLQQESQKLKNWALGLEKHNQELKHTYRELRRSRAIRIATRLGLVNLDSATSEENS